MIRFKKIKGNLKERIPKLVAEFKRDTNINALYLFGSYAKNEIKPLSDIDIAVLLKKRIDSSRYWDIKLDLLSKGIKSLETDEIDFVLLNEAPYDLTYNILKEGKILFCRNERERQEFQEKTVSNYLDTKYLREEIYYHLIERIKTGRFGYDEGKYKEDFENTRRIFGEIKTHSQDAKG